MMKRYLIERAAVISVLLVLLFVPFLSKAAVSELSQIALGSTPLATEYIIGVQSGNTTDARYTVAQVAASIMASPSVTGVMTIGGAGNPSTGLIVSSDNTNNTSFEVINTSSGGHAYFGLSTGSANHPGSFYFYDATANATSLSISPAGSVILSPGFAVGSLPPGFPGAHAFVTDAMTCTFGAPLTGGGGLYCPVFYGVSWLGG
jgi:hypothetical protein